MAEHVIRLPDVGEGVAEAELVEWHVKIGDLVREDAILAAVMTDKATVEIPSPVEGEIVWLGAEIGDVVAVGSDLVRLKVPGDDKGCRCQERHGDGSPPERQPAVPAKASVGDAETRAACVRSCQNPLSEPVSQAAPLRHFGRRRCPSGRRETHGCAGGSPAGTRGRHRSAPGSRHAARPAASPTRIWMHSSRSGPRRRGRQRPSAEDAVEDIKVIGLRRRIAERMALANSRIPHITYVEEVDVTALEELRATLNKQKRQDQPRLTLLPFLMRAMVRAIAEQPKLNALFDDEEGVVHQHAGVHIGIATQTPAGLMVPVVRHAEARDLWDCAAEVTRLAEAAKAGTATREELTGSTITITSLGAMGGVVTTPIINHPEVAIIGVNKIMVRPVWDGSAFIPRKMMNLSSSFDHRVVDGWDAAIFVQRIKALLETPALIFIEG